MESFTPDNFFNEPKWLDETDTKLTPMQEFYKGKTAFVTGATGFLGQLYVEKLLRCDAKRVYVLGRSKKGQSAEKRIKDTLVGVHFSKLNKKDPNYLERVTIVEGEMGKLKMGISESDWQELIANVEIVIHAAADVRFDEKLHTLLMINLRGTREILELTCQMKNIKAFTFISTAYSHCVESYVEEKFYDAPVDPEIMIKLGEYYNTHSRDELEIVTERIIKPWPNTYTFTKSLTEELVRRYGTKFPVCIIRPTIVISTHEDPVPAWCNNIYGLNGVLVAVGVGVLRLLPLNDQFVGDVVCADFVINSTLAALWVTYKDSVKNSILTKSIDKDPEIYHVCTSTDRPTTWGTISRSMCASFKEFPAKKVFWIPLPNSVPNPFWFTYLTICYHVIPGALTDIGLKLAGKSIRVLPVYRKAQRFMVALSYFMRRDWRFDNSNMKRVLARMTPEDQDFFPSDVRRYNWSQFRYSYLLGLKVYIGLENLDDVSKAKNNYKIYEVLHYFVLLIYYGLHIGIFTLLADKLGVFQYIRNSVYDTYDFLKNPELIYL